MELPSKRLSIFLEMYLEPCQTFSQSALSKMFGRVLNTYLFPLGKKSHYSGLMINI